MTTKHERSLLNHLLREVSWVGKDIFKYRDGGVGFENVLSAETLQAIDFLPRTQFLGQILRGAHGADAGRLMLADEAEDCEIELLPGDIFLRDKTNEKDRGYSVQPDGLIKSNGAFCVVEAKRIKRNQFQEDQLSKEYFIAKRDCKGRQPLLLLILSKPPPVLVEGHGRLAIAEAIRLCLDDVYKKSERPRLTIEDFIAGIEECYAWITWAEMANIVREQAKAFEKNTSSIERCVTRLSDSFLDAVKRHG